MMFLFTDVRTLWGHLSPNVQAWIKGCVWAMLTAMFNTVVASPFTTWKGMIVIALSSAGTGFQLYRAHSPFPRDIWTTDQRETKQLLDDLKANAAAAGKP